MISRTSSKQESDEYSAINSIWDEIGYTAEEKEEGIRKIQSEIEKVRSEFISKTLEQCQKITNETEQIRSKHIAMLKAIDGPKEEINAVLENGKTGTIKEKYESVKNKFKEFSIIYKKKYDEFDSLQKEINNCFNSLGITDKNEKGEFAEIGETDLTLQRLRRYEKKINQLSEEVDSRSTKFEEIKNNILTISSNVQEPLPPDIESLINGNVYSDDVLEKLNDYLEDMEELFDTRKRYISEMAVEISRLWNLLNVSEAERRQFLSSHNTLSQKNVQACINEAERLTQIRDSNLPELIRRLKHELIDVCKSLGYSSKQRQEIIEKCQTTTQTTTELIEEEEDGESLTHETTNNDKSTAEELTPNEDTKPLNEEETKNEETKNETPSNEDTTTEINCGKSLNEESTTNEETKNEKPLNEEETKNEETKNETPSNEDTTTEINCENALNEESTTNEETKNKKPLNEESTTNEETKNEKPLNEESTTDINYENTLNEETKNEANNEKLLNVDTNNETLKEDEKPKNEGENTFNETTKLDFDHLQFEDQLKIFNNYNDELVHLQKVQLIAQPIIDLINQRKEIISEYDELMNKPKTTESEIKEETPDMAKSKRFDQLNGKGIKLKNQRVRLEDPKDKHHAEKVTRRHKMVLPRVEKKLYILLVQFRNEQNGEDFLWEGKPIIDELKHVNVAQSEIDQNTEYFQKKKRVSIQHIDDDNIRDDKQIKRRKSLNVSSQNKLKKEPETMKSRRMRKSELPKKMKPLTE